MAKFKFIHWLVDFLSSRTDFIFEWDEGNSTKSDEKHGVSISSVESAFLDKRMLVLGEQYQPITTEKRYGIVARSHEEVLIFICFTIREGKIRPISARPTNQKERMFYEG